MCLVNKPESSFQETQVIEAPPEEHVDTRNLKPPETKTELAPDISNLVMEKLQSSAEEDEEPLTIHIWDFAGHELYYTTHQVTSCSYLYFISVVIYYLAGSMSIILSPFFLPLIWHVWVPSSLCCPVSSFYVFLLVFFFHSSSNHILNHSCLTVCPIHFFCRSLIA